jgi:hypothetical protein
MVGVEGTTGVGGFLPSGGTLDALPMPLGSLSTLGLAGPNGTPLIGALPAPAVPAGGVSCAKACSGTIRLPSAKASAKPSAKPRKSAELRDIKVPPGCTFNNEVRRAFPRARQSTLRYHHGFGSCAAVHPFPVQP